jgi:hypothetical protein
MNPIAMGILNECLFRYTNGANLDDYTSLIPISKNILKEQESPVYSSTSRFRDTCQKMSMPKFKL